MGKVQETACKLGLVVEDAVFFIDPEKLGIEKMLIMAQPFSPERPRCFDVEDFLPLVRKFQGRFFGSGGGGSLNLMIQEANQAGLSSQRGLPGLSLIKNSSAGMHRTSLILRHSLPRWRKSVLASG